MPIPILGVMALQGAASGLAGLLSASEEDRAARKANNAIDDAMKRIDSQREESRRDFSNTAESFLTNYALVRDPQKAEGIRASYSQERQRQDARDTRYDDTQLRLESARPQSGSSILGSTLAGIGIGAAAGASQALGQSLGSAGSAGSAAGGSGGAVVPLSPLTPPTTPTSSGLDFGNPLEPSNNLNLGFRTDTKFQHDYLKKVRPDQFGIYPL